MRKHRLVVTTALLCASSAIAQTNVAMVKGHKIGEPLAEYMASVPGGSEQLANCRSAVADPKAARKLKVDPRSCAALVGAADRGARIETNAGRAMPYGKATFDGGVLVKLTFPIGYDPLVPIRSQELISFEQVVADLQAKFGQPTTTDELTTQNGFGATFRHRRCVWDLSAAHVEALESDATIGKMVTTVTLQAQTDRAKQEAVFADRKSSVVN
jgi:hypothetical protein